MPTLEQDFGGIAGGLFLSCIGLLSVAVSLFRLRGRDFSLLNFGLFCFLYGIRWLVEIPTMRLLVGSPFTFPYFHSLLTYALIIPFTAFLVDIFGSGWHDSMLWVFRTTIIYALAAIVYDLTRPGPLGDVSIVPAVIVVWTLVGFANILFVRKEKQIELRILRVAFLAMLAYLAIDNLVNIRVLPGGENFEHIAFILFCSSLGYVAVHHFFSNEQRLLAIDKEIEIARRIQYSNLPKSLLSPGGLSVAARYVPMSTIAGDFYDLQERTGSGVGVLIADVAGHGIGPALIGSMLKIAFASQVEQLSDPARILMEINRVLQGRMEDAYVTACALFVDIVNKRVVYANAGHPPPFLVRAREVDIHHFPPGGTILGPFPDAAYENMTFHLVENDRLVLYTDGVTETRSRTGELFGYDRFVKFVREHASASTDRIADKIIDHLHAWAGSASAGSLDDDLTLLVIDVKA